MKCSQYVAKPVVFLHFISKQNTFGCTSTWVLKLRFCTTVNRKSKIKNKRISEGLITDVLPVQYRPYWALFII